MSERTRFVGLDVHKATVAVAVAEEVGNPESYGEVPNEPPALRKLVGRLGGPGIRLSVAYEAGPPGYALHRQLNGWGMECMVVAPSLIPTRRGDRVKTDRRDALQLARRLHVFFESPLAQRHLVVQPGILHAAGHLRREQR